MSSSSAHSAGKRDESARCDVKLVAATVRKRTMGSDVRSRFRTLGLIGGILDPFSAPKANPNPTVFRTSETAVGIAPLCGLSGVLLNQDSDDVDHHYHILRP